MADDDMTVNAGGDTDNITVEVDYTDDDMTVNAGGDTTDFYSLLSRQWAIKMDGMVQNEDYSSKYWAMQSKNNADYVRENKDSVVSQINSIKNTTINDIDTAVTNAETDITAAKDTAINDIKEQENTSVEKVKDTTTDAITDIDTTKTSAQESLTAIQDDVTELYKSITNKEAIVVSSYDIKYADETLTFTDSTKITRSNDVAMKSDVEEVKNFETEEMNEIVDLINERTSSMTDLTSN